MLILKKLFKRIYINYLQLKWKNLNVIFGAGVALNKQTRLNGSNSVGDKSNIENSSLGFGTYIGYQCELTNAEIGNYCSIGSRICILTNNHPVRKFVSTHPAFHRATHPLMKVLDLSFGSYDLYPNNIYVKNDVKVIIGSDVWVGDYVKILPGVTIGHGAVIAAGSIVTKDIEPYAIVGGIPAKKINYRFSLEEINWLLKYKWWELPIDILRTKYTLFSDIKNIMK